MNLILCFFFLSLASKRWGIAASGEPEVPSFIENNNNDEHAYALQSSSEEINALITNLPNKTKPISEMTINERAQLSELLYIHYKKASSLIHQLPIPEDNSHMKTALRMLIDSEESGDKTLKEANRILRSIASETEGGNNQHYNSDHTTNQGFKESNSKDNDSSWHENSRYHRRTTEKTRLHTHKFKNMRLDNHYDRIAKVQEAVKKGDFGYIHSHMYGDRHRGGASSWSQSGGTREGRRLAREARRLSSKRDKCKLLAKCAGRMSDYDLFVYLFSDDIDHITGDIDGDVKKIFGENISEMKTKIETLVATINADGPKFDSDCNDLLKLFHRTVEVEKIPQWEGATISQVCLAEGTTVYVDLGAAAKTALPSASRDFCPSKQHRLRYGDGRVERVDAKDSDKHAVVCCADKKIGDEWVKRESNECSVHVASKIDGQCFDEKTWDEADAICKGVGARLCSAMEVESGCTKDLGDDNCNMNDKQVKTETCSDNTFIARYASHWTVCGGDSGDCSENKHGYGSDNEKQEGDWAQRAVRCCSDQDLPYWTKSCNDGRDVWTNTKLESNEDDEACKILFWWEAERRCTTWQEGSRLCTRDELNNGCAQKKDCGYDDRLVWSSDSTFSLGVEELANSISDVTKDAFNDHIVPGFVKEVLVCAKDLFYTKDRTNDPTYEKEKFVFGRSGNNPGDDLDNYHIPKALSTEDSSMRTEHGQIKNNENPPFTFVTIQHLIDDFHSCRDQAKETLITTATDKFGDKHTATHTDIISYLEAGIDAYEEKIKDTCITNFFEEITLGLKLVFGDKPSVGFICGIKDVIEDGDAKMPGSCCLDAPFNLDGEDWGYGYDCKLTCKNKGSYFAGMSEEACRAQGGTWCPNKNDCMKLKKCVRDMKTRAKKDQPAFLDYLTRSPEIKDPNDANQCGKARQYFGHDENFVNDEQVCEDIEQLSFSKDFDFLNEFFGQGSESGGVSTTTGDKEIEAPDVPALVLTKVNRETTEGKNVKDGPLWNKLNFSFEIVISALWFVIDLLDKPCPCDQSCASTTVCKVAKGLADIVAGTIKFIFVLTFEISAFTMGQLAEQNNIQPMQVWENSQAVYGNMDETGTWLQARFEDIGKYFEDEFDVQTKKLKKVETVVERRDLSVNQSISGFSSMDDEYGSCHDLKMDIVIGSLSPRAIVCHLTCGDNATNPHVLEVRALNANENEVVVEHESFELEKGLIILEIPDHIEANIFIITGRIQNTYGDDDRVVEESISFPVKNKPSLSSYIYEKLFVSG